MATTRNRREFIQAAGVTGAALLAGGEAPVQAQAARTPAPARTMGARFRELLQRRDPFEALAAYDGFTARMVEVFGYPSLFIGGSLLADDRVEPVWLTTMAERIEYARRMTETVEIPALVDVDSGGGPMDIYRLTKQFERANVGAIHILDDVSGPMGRVTGVLPVAKMVDKIKAALDARSDMVVTVRCTAASMAGGETKDRAMARAAEYAQAGAESVWFTGMTLDDMPRAAEVARIPITAQLFMDTTMAQAKAARVTVAVYASLLQNIAQSAVYDALTELKTTGTMQKSAGGVRLGGRIPAEFRQRIMRTAEIAERGKKFNVGT